MTTKGLTRSFVAVAVIAGLAPASPAVAAARGGCDSRGGTTLAATGLLRMFYTKKPKAPAKRPGVFVCRYPGSKDFRMTLGSLKPVRFGVNGPAAFVTGESAGDGHDAGELFTNVSVVNVVTRVRTHALATAVALRDTSVTPTGVFSAIAESSGIQPLLTPTDPSSPQLAPTSSVVYLDPAAESRGLQAVATGPPGSFVDLAASDTSLYWRTSSGGVGTSQLPAAQ